jgi:hypothetical protein
MAVRSAPQYGQISLAWLIICSNSRQVYMCGLSERKHHLPWIILRLQPSCFEISEMATPAILYPFDSDPVTIQMSPLNLASKDLPVQISSSI